MNLAPLPIADVFPPLPQIPRAPRDRVHAALLRRIDAAAQRRAEAALTPMGGQQAFDNWKRNLERGDKLRRALIQHLSRP